MSAVRVGNLREVTTVYRSINVVHEWGHGVSDHTDYTIGRTGESVTITKGGTTVLSGPLELLVQIAAAVSVLAASDDQPPSGFPCQATSPSDYMCGLPTGHVGEHVARAKGGLLVDRWPQ